MLELTASRLLFLADLLLGIARGSRCPNCRTPGAQNPRAAVRWSGLATIRSCKGCGLLYRPTGWTGGPLLEAYYSWAYGNAGIATQPQAFHEEAALLLAVREAGKDRGPLLSGILGGRRVGRLCVVGCSWGYEMISLAGYAERVVGVELSRVRREFGRSRLGLEIYPDVESLAAASGPVDVVLSSHVLEHIPALERVLDSVQAVLKPSIQVHVTPEVDEAAVDPAAARAIGREHPIGVTSRFWVRFAERRGLALEERVVGWVPGVALGERVAVLRAPSSRSVDLP